MPSEQITNNKFLQVLLAARRAKQLINGDRKRIESKSDNPLSVAMEEIRHGKIDFNDIFHTPLFVEKEPEAEVAEAITGETPLSELLVDVTEVEAEAEEEEETEVEKTK